MKTYTIRRLHDGVSVHSSISGGPEFEIPNEANLYDFGYSGPGPRLLAQAILYDCCAKKAIDAALLAAGQALAFSLNFLADTAADKPIVKISEREIMRWLANRRAVAGSPR